MKSRYLLKVKKTRNLTPETVSFFSQNLFMATAHIITLTLTRIFTGCPGAVRPAAVMRISLLHLSQLNLPLIFRRRFIWRRTSPLYRVSLILSCTSPRTRRVKIYTGLNFLRNNKRAFLFLSLIPSSVQLNLLTYGYVSME